MRWTAPAVLLAGLLTGCSGSSMDCGEQTALVKTLAADAAFDRVPVEDRPEAEWHLPCRGDGSGDPVVSAGQSYRLPEPVSYDEIAEVASVVAGPAEWTEIGHVRPEWGGGTGGEALFCYRSASDEHRYLTVTTDDAVGHQGKPPAAFQNVLVMVLQAEAGREVCPA